MPAQLIPVVGAGVAGLLSLAATLAAVAGLWWVVVLVVTLLAAATLVVALDADRRIRETRRFLHRELGRLEVAGAQQGRAAPTTEDVVGTVRAIQAQYTGRLDRLQDAVEEVLRRDDRD